MITCRRAAVEDAESIARVHVTSWRETYRGIVPDDALDRLSVERRAERWAASLADPEGEFGTVFVAESDHKIVGFASCGAEREGDPVYRGELFAIYILKFSQGRGIGRQLVRCAANDLLGRGLSSMLVWVLAENPARGFYERLGGKYLREKFIEIGGANLVEVAYGWQDIHLLAGEDGGKMIGGESV